MIVSIYNNIWIKRNRKGNRNFECNQYQGIDFRDINTCGKRKCLSKYINSTLFS